MTYSIIQKSQLEGSLRLDAEYYQPEYLDIGKKLHGCTNLDLISKKITDFGAYSQMNFVSYVDNGVRFFRNQDVDEFFINDADPIYISQETYRKLSLNLEEFDIITPRVGTVGNASVIFKYHLPASANQNLAQIKPDQKKIDPLYLSVFLNSKYGNKQFERLSTGNVQPWLNLSQIKSIKIFIPSYEDQMMIRKISEKALLEINSSKKLYQKAENLLLEELGLKDYKIEDDLSCVVKLSELKSASRIDAEYFQPKYNKIIKFFDNKIDTLKNLARRKTLNVEIIKDTEYNYIEIGDVDVGNGNINSNKLIGSELPANAKIKITGGELLISKVRPTRGAIAIVPLDWKKNFIASGAFSVFDVEPPLREYLQIVLKSIIGKLQMEKPTTGTSYPTITDEDVENIKIPVLSRNIQQKIAGLVRQFHEARKKSKELLEEAKRKVEELIEKK